ncbi:MAG TPA: hypothetical protein VF980_04060 [Thermoanaerobaculia bacterium]
MTEQPQKPAAASPAVKQLLKDDPDLTRKLTPEEVQAALEAARSAPQPHPADQPALTSSDSEWRRLEADQQAREQAYRERLEQTTVYVVPGDDHYHSAGCDLLYGVYFVGGMLGERRFIGTPINLATAKERGLQPHRACGAPGYEFHYQ